ncbi:hypothetical protein TELCIR_10632, partial [Teladorsagia circumcincta]
MLMQAAYNEPGGLKLCELISSHLIDHFVPFLPMERRHVILCTIGYLKSQGREDLINDDELVQRIVDSLQEKAVPNGADASGALAHMPGCL